MSNINFSNRHKKLIELKDNIELLRLGQKNKEYIEIIENLRTKVIEELKKEQAAAGIKISNNINHLPKGKFKLLQN